MTWWGKKINERALEFGGFILLLLLFFCAILTFFSVLSFLFQKLENGLWVFWQFKNVKLTSRCYCC